MHTLIFGMILACTPKDAGQVDFGGDSALGGDSGGDGGGDSGGDGGGDGGGEMFEDTDPEFSADINGGGWSVSPGEEGHTGYFTANTIYAALVTGGDTAQTVSIQIDGDLQVPGTYSVLYVSYTFQVAQDTPVVYDVKNPEGFQIQVKGYAEEGYDEALYVFAQSEGEATLSDGGTLSDVELENYPYFYAR